MAQAFPQSSVAVKGANNQAVQPFKNDTGHPSNGLRLQAQNATKMFFAGGLV